MRDPIKDEGRRARDPVLAVEDLRLRLEGKTDPIVVADGLSFEIAAGETLGLSGRSGAGKTALALGLIGLSPGDTAMSLRGSIRLGGREISGLGPRDWPAVRGREIGLVPQDPSGSLTPVRRVGDLLAEIVYAHGEPGGATSPGRLLAEVGFEDPDSIARLHPHELSGGMRQRVAIAAALAGEPRLLLADEPTSSLDVIAGRQIMELLASIQRRRSMAMLLISHDRRILGRFADREFELSSGRLAPVRAADPAASKRPAIAPRELPGARPSHEGRPPALRLVDLRREFAGKGRRVRAVDGVSLEIEPGDSVGLIGPTGSGKSTLARCAVGLLDPTGGSVSVGGRDPNVRPRRRTGTARPPVGMVFQDSPGSFNPARRLGDSIEAPLRSEGVAPPERARSVADAVRAARLEPDLLGRYPGQLSGGQLQRGAVARALVTKPELLMLDEPFTATDGRTETELVELLNDLRAERGLALLLITHDIRLATRLTRRILVMDGGTIVEDGPAWRVLAEPRERITRELVTAAFDE